MFKAIWLDGNIEVTIYAVDCRDIRNPNSVMFLVYNGNAHSYERWCWVPAHNFRPITEPKPENPFKQEPKWGESRYI